MLTTKTFKVNATLWPSLTNLCIYFSVYSLQPKCKFLFCKSTQFVFESQKFVEQARLATKTLKVNATYVVRNLGIRLLNGETYIIDKYFVLVLKYVF